MSDFTSEDIDRYLESLAAMKREKFPRELRPGDIVQLDPTQTSNKMFSACLMTVSEVKDWGVHGFVQALGEKGEMGGRAYYRAVWGTFEFTGGKNVWMPAEENEEESRDSLQSEESV